MAGTAIHFAGVNTALLTQAVEGRDVLISFADVLRRPGWWEREMLPRLAAGRFGRVILDSGAFTVISAGITIDVETYAAFAAKHQDLFDVVVGLDDIAGDLGTTWRNQAVLEAAGVKAMPVFHQGEPLAVLDHYADRYDEIGLGFARLPGGRFATSLADRKAWLAEAFALIGDRARVHGFGMTRLAGEGFPFASVDSTTWIAEYRGLRTESETATHAIYGELADVFDWYDDAELVEIALDSYDPPAGDEDDAERLAEIAGWIEGGAKGQARTVLRRYGARGLAAKIDALDARKCRRAA